jgi:hypothetical protein
MRELILLIFILFLSGCLPEERRNIPIDDTSAPSRDFNSTPNSNNSNNSSQYIRWFHLSTFTSNLTVDFNNTNSVYLRGSDLSNYIKVNNNYSSTFCLNIDFNSGAIISKDLRVRAIPKQLTNQTSGITEYYLKVDLHDVDSNQLCNLGIETYNSISNNYSYVAPPVLANKTEDVCPTCLNIVGSNAVSLYQIRNSETNMAPTALQIVTPNLINYSSLIFRIDMNNNSTNNVGTCTNASCHVQGFDCCLSNQCVNEKSTKVSGINADPTGFAQAELEKTTNPNWYLKYPQFYYSCLIQAPTEDEEEDEGNPEADAQAFLTSMIADFNCITELDENSLSEPFHFDPYNTSETYTACNMTNSAHNMYYETVMSRMYKYCGCALNNLTDMINLCPSYTYKANKTNNVITSITCNTPPTPNGSSPFQNYNVQVSSNSAPHRYFNTAGVEYNPDALSGNPTNTTQEGDTFQYLDSQKIVPDTNAFNMNAILGQMSVNLDEARPAKSIDIEFDQVYFIATLSGSYTPCPQCGKDSWFSNFTAFPTTQMGSGLEAVGHNTERDSWGTNTTYGNYEDTIFGRACWLPPTMLAFSHANFGSVQTQRLNRLQTQSALYMNGYQRDWYGFNKGALIGSFDGITWFAIGKGRIIRSTSNKLFLAINAPFADLASPTQHVVAVKEYDGLSSGAHHDFDPSLVLNHPSQNSAGTCQNYHQCETDTDCVSALGWEYTCADVNQYKTFWPKTNAIGAAEVANTSNSGLISNFLATGELPQGSSYRCVYRGAGSPCRVDYRNISDSGKREALACAPNFYCANLNSTTPVFNYEIARFAAPLEDILASPNHYFGQDAKVLGRPYHYITGSKLSTLASYSNIKSSIENNILLMDSTASGNVGICRPGRSLASYSGDYSATNIDPNLQQETRDASLRTDYISQISGCNSSLYNEFRYTSCPMIGSDGNFVHLDSGFLTNSYTINSSAHTKVQTIRKLANSQNACGLETIDSNFTGTLRNGNSYSSLSNASPLKAIEGLPLNSGAANIEPTLARDACMRKAGSVCHTDYDCSPNKMMSDQVDLYNLSYFGNNAEKKYYEEYLVCGQGKDKPYFNDEDFGDYSMPQNRCCREIGKDLTMYTANTSGDSDTTGLQPLAFGGYNPKFDKKYSRYSNLEFDTYNQAGGVIYATNTLGSSKAYGTPDASSPFTPYQWRTINDSGSKTCCGGGWIRKFADGTNDWTKNRLNLDVNNFKCLNYRTHMLDDLDSTYISWINSFDPSFQLDLWSQDTGEFCKDSKKGEDATTSCAQYPISDSSTAYSAVAPVGDEWTAPALNIWQRAELNTINFEKSTLDWVFYNAKSADNVNLNYLDWSAHPTNHKRNNIRITIPSYMTLHPDNIGASQTTVRFVEKDNPTNNHNCTYMGANSGNAPTTELHYDGSGATCNPGAGPNCCWYFDYNIITKTRTISLVWDNLYASASGKDWGALIQFPAPGTRQFQAAAGRPWGEMASEPSTKPGNYLYYLYRLARLELIGIPQATFPPLYCNNHPSYVVPGIFKETMTTMSSFASGTGVINDPFLTIEMGAPYNSGANASKVGTQSSLQIDPIFSANDFKCCRKLGMETDEATQCCSGYAVEESGTSEDKKKICKLPSGVSLNVYFNKFVSSEGIGSELPGGGLSESDFNSVTGEIKTNQTTLQKLTTMGKTYCESGKVRRGGIFGRFPGQPGTTDSGTVYSIVDSTSDIGESSSAGETVEVGYDVFRAGIRWNHHVYCDINGGN